MSLPTVWESDHESAIRNHLVMIGSRRRRLTAGVSLALVTCATIIALVHGYRNGLSKCAPQSGSRQCIAAFQLPKVASSRLVVAAARSKPSTLYAKNAESQDSGETRRRGAVSRAQGLKDSVRGLLTATVLITAGSFSNPSTGLAVEAEQQKRLWMSGKSDKPKGSKDTKGTKKDYGYLRCLSDCTTDCKKPGTVGPQRDSSECLELCQDYCCQTYEQCTYTLRKGEE